MEDGANKDQSKPEEKGWAEKAKKLVDKADDFISEKVEKVKKSKAFDSLSDSIDEAGEYIEEKVEEIKKGHLKEKMEAFGNKIEDETKDGLEKAKKFGKKVAGKSADTLENLAGNIREKTKEDPKPEDPQQQT